MGTKLSFTDIADLFALKSRLNKKEAELFLRELLDIMSSKMCEDGLLKVRDFGTFKVVEVESRESIDVNSGTKIVIASHRKISFTPDKTLKDLVNKPFALFEPELLNDGVTFEQPTSDKTQEEDIEENETDGEQEIELPESTNMQGRLSKALGDASFDSVSKEDPATENFPTEDEVQEVTPLEEIKTEALLVPSEEASHLPEAEENPVADEPMAEENSTDEMQTLGAEQENKKSKNSRIPWIVGGTIFLVVAVAAVAYYFLYVYDCGANKPLLVATPASTTHTKVVASTPPAPNVVTEKDTLSDKTAAQPKVDSTKTSATKVIEEKETPKEKETEKTKTNAQVKGLTEVVSEGATFRTLALKHYGSKEFWVYIYQANKAKIPHPNMLRYGLKVTIPDAQSLGIDAQNPASIKRAKQLSDKVLNEEN